MPGTLFLVVGPSGVGKDTLLEGAREALEGTWFRFPRRVITRPADAGGEDHTPATDASFEEMVSSGAFLHHWKAHGLRYGIPRDIISDLEAGVNVVVNTSRMEVEAFQRESQRAVVIYINASKDITAARLKARGRETEKEINRRLARIVEQSAHTEGAVQIFNDTTVEEGTEKLVEVITGSCDLHAKINEFPVDFASKPLCLLHSGNPVATRLMAGTERVGLFANGKSITADLGWTDTESFVAKDNCAVSEKVLSALGVESGQTVRIERSPAPESRAILQKKVRGAELNSNEIHSMVRDLVHGRFSTAEIAGFLVSASRNLTIDEVIELTKARARYAHKQKWNADIVVDKHSMGGIPGNRISPIIIPIIAAFGLTMPKTSSRAITSAAGTADIMEVLARVDLTPAQMAQVVNKTGACIAWNGRLTHSPVDDVMNSINRPLGLASALLDTSSILSKKLAAGSTHVLIDLPIGPQAKTVSREDGESLKQLFETVGAGVGLKVHANLADGTKPVGRGVGPVLETIDVLNVLSNEPDAPQDLLEKSVQYAAHILEWTGAVDKGQGQGKALGIVTSGDAYEKLQEIVLAQGGQEEKLKPGRFTSEIAADRSGTIEEIDIRTIGSIARAAGAPLDKSAGIYLCANVSSKVEEGQPLLRIHASSQKALDEAVAKADQSASIVRKWSEGSCLINST
ncbi:MAG: phosphonate metabolism protein/1,5-bisphosphokinase (PRPP-forming) PhnN [Alphaproteobacteria bacterium]|nr:phosphonate metabolism protein/1,5-bisphosphokinase (PRPP-forming) PhnN [Alphaproteobacteria bacterium]